MPGLALNEWGPGAWNTLHAIAHTSPKTLTPDQIDTYSAFFNTFADLLPCPRCRTHFREFLRARMSPVTLATREAMVELMNDAHNEVNRSKGKRAYSIQQHYAVYNLRKPRTNLFAMGSMASIAVFLVHRVYVSHPRNRV